MRLLIIHQNFPGQFRHMAQAWAERPGWEVTGIGRDTAPGLPGVRWLRYRPHLCHEHVFKHATAAPRTKAHRKPALQMNRRRQRVLPEAGAAGLPAMVHGRVGREPGRRYERVVGEVPPPSVVDGGVSMEGLAGWASKFSIAWATAVSLGFAPCGVPGMECSVQGHKLTK